jgi:hypothetical protein
MTIEFKRPKSPVHNINENIYFDRYGKLLSQLDPYGMVDYHNGAN